ncbi:hypothetical protein LIER_14082 [Lithospermum erythrorhizon]|uniref:Reverse transcriptase domain-containing protein n=1 Tax=Lithospermum erythrorhizon TaxID=34254 RepID=A0AAV3Q2E3_LITER
MRGAPGKRDKNLYCEYHLEHGHDTNECRILKVEIEKLIKQGYLREDVGQEKGRPHGRGYSPPCDHNCAIAGRGDSQNARKNYSRREVYNAVGTISMSEPISFSDSELKGIELPYDDPVVITPLIANFIVERMLVDKESSTDILYDKESSTDILYLSTHDKLHLPRSHIQPIATLLTGFTGHVVYPLGIATLDLTVGTGNKTTTIKAQFTVVDINDPSYNGLIGRPIPHEEIEEDPFNPAVEDRAFKIGTRQDDAHREALILLIRGLRTCSWGPEDIPGVDPEITMHRLHVDSMFVPIKQRKRTFSDEKNMVLQIEVEPLLNARAICELQFLEWSRT